MAEMDIGDGWREEDVPINDEEITEDDSWTVISKYFEEFGLVRQQIDSFNEFIGNTMQSLVDETPPVQIYPESQYMPGKMVDDKKRYVINFGQLRLGKCSFTEPNGEIRTLFPNMARLRNLVYSAPLYCDVTKTIIEPDDMGDDHEESEAPVKVFLGHVPIMLKSKYCILDGLNDEKLAILGECPVDQGGYFIINGSEKVLLAQERMSANHVFVFKKTQPSKFTYGAEIRSVSEVGNRPSSGFQVKIYNQHSSRSGSNTASGSQLIVATLPYIRQDIPIAVLFRALNVRSDKEIMQYICHSMDDEDMATLLMPSIEEGAAIVDEEVALDFIGKRGSNQPFNRTARLQYAREILQLEFLPHVGVGEGFESRKAYFLGYMVNRLLQVVLGRRDPDDRDHYGNKRLDLAGPLLGGLFRQLFRKVVKEARRNFEYQVNSGRELSVQGGAIKSSIITNGLKYALATGNWNADRKAGVRTGVSQVLNRLTFASSLSHLRRLNSPIGREGKLAKPRQLHNTHWGMVCPAETPEGGACGLVKNIALMSYISVGVGAESVIGFLEEWNTENLTDLQSPEAAHQGVKVFVNGNWIGIHREIETVTNAIRDLRRKGDIREEVSIIVDLQYKEVKLYCDAGRICRPLYVVQQPPPDHDHMGQTMVPRLAIRRGHIDELKHDGDYPSGVLPRNTFSYLMRKGVVEYIDCEEEETTMVAMKMSDLRSITTHMFTHCEIHPSMILGVCASIIPFPDHNQSPRNTYQSAMGKQAMGVYITSFKSRMDTMAHVLYYPQKPLVATRAMEHLKFRALPSGINAIAAIACYSGYNQEDSLILNQSSIDRGFMRSVYFRSFSEEEQRKLGGAKESFEIPQRSECIGMKPGSYEKLEEDGLVTEGEQISGNDILVGKTAPLPNAEELGAAPGQESAQVASKSKKDVSVGAKATESGVVDKVMVAQSKDGARFVKIRLRSVRVPQVGDKFASRHGQKGTCGIAYRQEDLPFTAEGVVPDIIVNPHAIPSRMTVGHLIECLLGKVSSLLGTEGDATPFTEVTVDDISKRLQECGFQSRGWEMMYNGHTGRPLEAQIFIGPTYYQRLKHMVDDKIHSRATGPVANLTHQPLEGRARGGGLRFGEMERDCLHGDTRVTLASGVSMRIADLTHLPQVLTCSEQQTFVSVAPVNHLPRPQPKECLELVFSDGRSIVCTPQHLVMTYDGWVHAAELVPGHSQVVLGPDAPLYSPSDDTVEQLAAFKLMLHHSGRTLGMNDVASVAESHAFGRILGYFIASGSMWYDAEKDLYHGNLSVSHLIDAERILMDIELAVDQVCSIQHPHQDSNEYKVWLPAELLRDFHESFSILPGQRVFLAHSLPDLVLDPKCPKSFVREFLGGMFGANGLAPLPGSRSWKPVAFTMSKADGHQESSERLFSQLRALLARFDIKCTWRKAIANAQNNHQEKGVVHDTLVLKTSQIQAFQQRIGFRWSASKQQRLSVAAAYLRAKEYSCEQRRRFIARVNELTGQNTAHAVGGKRKRLVPLSSIQSAYAQTLDEMEEKEVYIDRGAAIPTYQAVQCGFKGVSTTNEAVGKMALAKWLEMVGASEFFADETIEKREVLESQVSPLAQRYTKGFPAWKAVFVGSKPAGSHLTYDISVPDSHNFLAEGVTVHNCMISHGAAAFLKERLMDQSDAYRVHVCEICGLFAIAELRRNVFMCRGCNNKTRIAQVHMPYAAKLLFQELMAMAIAPRMMT
eukprot:CAMPEP_0184699762 /NCGR_PEP_ID=MMETSP0313-20130426/5905_1 /TAXON_ID=2792 /ORGANISM="Porphyridium aerugineum, Strain SAG 1380-2" /LENGTH=1727 /DNA_ID=CAMNT_0027158887 /DNA_START=239 /DNA_END=5422 /DNA_ORIENTATION=+